jgi:transcriptional regulator with XRE-family HTH domain
LKTLEYLDAVKAKHGITSDYALAKVLNFSQSSLSLYRSGRRIFDDDVALRIATELGINPLAVIAAANAERAKTPEQRDLWHGIMEKFSASFRNLLQPWNGLERRVQAR